MRRYFGTDVVETAWLRTFLKATQAKFGDLAKCERDARKNGLNVDVAGHIYAELIQPFRTVLERAAASEMSCSVERDATSILLKHAYLAANHFVALFYDARNLFAVEQEVKQLYRLLYPLCRNAGQV